MKNAAWKVLVQNSCAFGSCVLLTVIVLVSISYIYMYIQMPFGKKCKNDVRVNIEYVIYTNIDVYAIVHTLKRSVYI